MQHEGAQKAERRARLQARRNPHVGHAVLAATPPDGPPRTGDRPAPPVVNLLERGQRLFGVPEYDTKKASVLRPTHSGTGP